MAETETKLEWAPPAGRQRWSDAEGRSLVEALRSSGESQAAFARRCGLNAQRVKYWVDRVRESGAKSGPGGAPKTPQVSFAPVRVVSTAAGNGSRSVAPLEVLVGAAVVRVPRGFDEEHLACVVRALGGGAAC